jgi:circadian clock protein KaiB
MDMAHAKQKEAASEKNSDSGIDSTLAEFEKLVATLARPTYCFRLYVSGASSRSAVAIENVRRICEKYLAGHYELEVVDIYQQPAQTKAAQVIAVPTLIKELPFPPQRFVGDMSNTERIVVGLNLDNRAASY